MIATAQTSTSQRIMDVAEGLVQSRGFNGFSYADISAELGITKASIHHHFPSKADLGEALVERYHHAFMGALAAIDETAAGCASKLQRYQELYASVLSNGNRMCLCGMLAADFTTLPEPMRLALQRFFDANEAWLTGVLEKGREEDALHFQGDARTQARVVVSSLEGAMLVARSYCDPERFNAVAARLMADIISPSPPPGRKAPGKKAGHK